MNEIHEGTRVELLPGRESIYKKAVAGSQAVVTAKKVDGDGFKMVYVEWDKDHWRYNGEPDGWTYEEHFKPAHKTGLFEAMDSPDQFAEHATDWAKDHGKSDKQIEQYLERLDEVVNLLSESEGFIILAARRELSPTQPDSQVTIPYIYGAFMSEPIMVLLEAQLVQMAAMANQEMSQKMMKWYKEVGEDDDDDSALL